MQPLTVLSDIVRRGAESYRDRIAVEGPSGEPSFSYGDLFEAARRGAGALRARGLERGDRVLVVMDGSPDWAVAFFSAVWADLVVVPIPEHVSPEMAALVASHAGARACIAKAGHDAIADRLAADVSCLMPSDLSAGAPWVTGPLATDSDLAVIVFTSGSTARPRAVELTHGNLTANLRSLMGLRQAAPDEALLSMLPPAHAYELVAGQLAPFASGARVVYAGIPLPNRLIAIIRERAITRVGLVPSLLDALCREVIDGLIADGVVGDACRHLSPASLAKSLRGRDAGGRERLVSAVRPRIGTSLRSAGLGGAAMTPEWSDVLAEFGIGVDIGYGLTEAGPLVSVGLAANCPRGSVGRPLPGVDVRIDAQGEILVRGPAVMRGYFKDAVASAHALDRGWLRTGDRGCIDARGFLYVTGRLKDAMVTADGETLYPEEVEPHYASPIFAEHCVVPMRGGDGNDVPTLVAVPVRPETTDADLQRVFAALRAAAPARCRVAAVVRRAARLPRTALGKLQRRALAEELQASRRAS